jgi:hypothetical protein
MCVIAIFQMTRLPLAGRRVSLFPARVVQLASRASTDTILSGDETALVFGDWGFFPAKQRRKAPGSKQKLRRDRARLVFDRQ